MMRSLPGFCVVLSLALGLSSCALLSKKAPTVPRYFTPEYDEDPSATPEGAPARPGMALRLGRVTAASNLRERQAYRTSQREMRYYEYRRWTDRPDSYLERALSRSLFERHGLTMVMSGSAPILQVELTAFEEITDPPHRVRAEATMVLQHENVAQVHDTIRIEEQVPKVDEDDEPEAVVQALSKALQAVVEQIAKRSMTALSAIEANAAVPATVPQEGASNRDRAP